MPDPIVVVEYDCEWPIVFESLRAKLAGALGDIAASIEHVGSTAVPNLAAKPTIDINVILPSSDHLPEAIRRLATIGYVHEGDLGVTGRHAFAVPPGYAPHHHHLYVGAPGNRAMLEHVVFRDHLRNHPEVAQAYGELKRALAQRFRNDRNGYTNAKAEFVNAVLRHAHRSV